MHVQEAVLSPIFTSVLCTGQASPAHLPARTPLGVAQSLTFSAPKGNVLSPSLADPLAGSPWVAALPPTCAACAPPVYSP